MPSARKTWKSYHNRPPGARLSRSDPRTINSGCKVVVVLKLSGGYCVPIVGPWFWV